MSDQWSNSDNDSITNNPLGGSTSGLGGDPRTRTGQTGGSSSSTTNAGRSKNPSGQPTDQNVGTMDRAKDVLTDAQHKASDLGGQAASKASELGEQATSQADAGMVKAADGLDSLASTIRSRTDSMGDNQVHTMAATAADKIESGAEMLRSKDTDQLVSDLESFVRRKPVESLLIAAGVGYMLSRAL